MLINDDYLCMFTETRPQTTKRKLTRKSSSWKETLVTVQGDGKPPEVSNLQVQAVLVLLQEQLLQLGEASDAERGELTKKIENLQHSLHGRNDFFAGGWLTKRATGGLRKWQRRWFVLQGTTLVYSHLVEKGRIQFGPKSMVVKVQPEMESKGVNRRGKYISFYHMTTYLTILMILLNDYNFWRSPGRIYFSLYNITEYSINLMILLY